MTAYESYLIEREFTEMHANRPFFCPYSWVFYQQHLALKTEDNLCATYEDWCIFRKVTSEYYMKTFGEVGCVAKWIIPYQEEYDEWGRTVKRYLNRILF